VMICKSKKMAKLPDTNITEKDVAKLETFKTFKAKDHIHIGDICVTPYLVSHSACDAYMFLIQDDYNSILHTGDFREHGYLGKGLIPTLEKYIAKHAVDVLITEGTMLSRLQENTKHENDLRIEAIGLLEKYKYSFVLCSSTDIDRLASFHEASATCKRSFLCDGYQKEVLNIFTANTVFKFDNAHFYKHNHEKQFELIKKKGFCMLIRNSQIKILKEILERLPAEETLLIYSMWDGYINKKVKNGENLIQKNLAIWNLFENKEKLHTSGHATAETLAKVCKLVNPEKAIIPIHSEHTADFSNLDISAELKEKIILSPIFQFKKSNKMRRLKGILPIKEVDTDAIVDKYLSEAPIREAEIERLACAEIENLTKLKEIAEKRKEQGDDDMVHRYLNYFSRCSELGFHEEIPYAYAENKFEERTGLKEGAKVRHNGRYDALYLTDMYSDPRQVLDLKTIYEIEYILIGRSYSIVKLVGFKEEEFYGGWFDAINKNEEKKCLIAGGHVRYIGASEKSFNTHGGFCSAPRNMLDLETIYEVEWIGKHPDYCGHRVIKLVGFEKELFHRIWFEKVIN